jgi:hypothetical protein
MAHLKAAFINTNPKSLAVEALADVVVGTVESTDNRLNHEDSPNKEISTIVRVLDEAGEGEHGVVTGASMLDRKPTNKHSLNSLTVQLARDGPAICQRNPFWRPKKDDIKPDSSCWKKSIDLPRRCEQKCALNCVRPTELVWPRKTKPVDKPNE